jgi:hypothetical protein
MAARVTQEEVLEIIDTSLTDLTVWINTANLFVGNTLSGAGLDETTLKEIERNLVAHFLSNRDMRVKAEKIDVISQTYAGQFGLGLNGTLYGQTAILLDSSGTLGAMAKKGYKQTASMSVLGYHDELV